MKLVLGILCFQQQPQSYYLIIISTYNHTIPLYRHKAINSDAKWVCVQCSLNNAMKIKMRKKHVEPLNVISFRSSFSLHSYI